MMSEVRIRRVLSCLHDLRCQGIDSVELAIAVVTDILGFQESDK